MLSVITPTYNCDKYILRSYSCLKNQTYSNWEWVIVDDGSTDSTSNVVRMISSIDPRVKAFSLSRNKGRGYARSYAVSKCCGNGIVIWDVDDLYMPDRLERIKNAFDQGYDYFCSYALLVDNDLNIKGARHFQEIKDKTIPSFVHPTLGFKRELADRVVYNKKMRAGEDLAVMLNLEWNFKGYYCEEYLMVYVEDREINLSKTILSHKNRLKTLANIFYSREHGLSRGEVFSSLANLILKHSFLLALSLFPSLYLKTVPLRYTTAVVSKKIKFEHIDILTESFKRDVMDH